MKCALICADGIGDALLMMICAHHLHKASIEVTIFHKQSSLLSPLFPWANFRPFLPLENALNELISFDRVLIQNDHSQKAFHLHTLRVSNHLTHWMMLLVTPSKHLAAAGDFLFSKSLSLVDNIRQATQKLFAFEHVTQDNGILALVPNTKKIFPKRVAIHPTSSDPQRNWRQEQFITLATTLKDQGYDPWFLMTSQETNAWKSANSCSIPIFTSDCLIDAAQFLYSSGFFIGNDSGMGHLASNYGVPTLTISGNPKRVKRWRPSFTLGHIVTLAFELPNFKGLVFRHFDGRVRDKYWHYFLSVGKVLKRFNHLVETYNNPSRSHDP